MGSSLQNGVGGWDAIEDNPPPFNFNPNSQELMEAKPVRGVYEKLLVEIVVFDARRAGARSPPVKLVFLHEP